ncbi:MAG: DNA-directed RNA polymerase subunit beta', partial [Flavobacteriales bacterium]|nr:DNA-directed RNA polymerase subunit beta' [Flavobacteriales bacterium]
QPKLIEGKAIQLHPLVCTAFNADFDGDQMAVHVPLGNAAILEAQLLMLASHNILNPANGAPIAVPSQDMVLGLYYITKGRKSTEEIPVKGEGMNFYSPEEVNIAYNEGRVDLHAHIKVRWTDPEGEASSIETTVGRVLFNEVVPDEVGYINEVLTKKALRDIIGKILSTVGTAKAAQFLDDIKELGFMSAFRGGLSFNLDDVVIPTDKEKLVKAAQSEVDEVTANYNMGLITNNERYNQIIDIWTHTNSKVTFTLMERLKNDRQGFNSIYMMMDSGARGSKEQIRQLSGMRGLMAKPQKSGGGGGQDIIENPILSNFKEGLSILEYFISTHGARKGLADTALKTADAGYLTRRLVDVAQDVVITEEDCGTLRGLVATALKKNEDVVETLYDRILGRTSVHDVYHPQTGDLLVSSGDTITEPIAEQIEASPIEEVEIRSVLTCETKQGVCAKCYGRNLANGQKVQMGEAVGVIAAQSIGEPGTQLTLRTFHVGGVAGKITEESEINAKYDGVLELEDLRTVKRKDRKGNDAEVVISRSTEMRIIDSNTGIVLTTSNIPYGAFIYRKSGDKVKKGDVVCTWDPYNAVILAEIPGKLAFESIEEGYTYREEIDEQTGFTEKVIVESRDKKKNPAIKIVDTKSKEDLKSYSLPVGAHIMVENGKQVEAGEVLVKIPRSSGKGGDITGGLPRVTELFEARNPSNPAVVSEIDGIVSYGKIKRGNREIIIESRTGERKFYLVPLSKHILVQENDFVKAGQPLSDGAVSPNDILNVQGPTRVQEYLVDEVQEVYRMQGVKINDKHFEVIVRQMMRKVEIEDPGDTRFLEKQAVNKTEFMEENDWIFDKMVVVNAGESAEMKEGQIITARKLRDENSVLKRKDQALVEARPAKPATAHTLLQGITRASLQTDSFISAASFQETTKVLNEAAVAAKEDTLNGLKENVIVGHLIPAGTGTRRFQKDLVYNVDDYQRLMAEKLEKLEIEE